MHPSYENQTPEERARHDEIVRSERERFLMKDGNLAVPCSRYGSDTEDCVPFAIALAEIVGDATGEPITFDALDYAMGLVVNDHDDVESLIRDHGSEEQRALLEDLDDDEEPHTGHYSRLGGTYWCDTCNSPYCDLA